MFWPTGRPKGSRFPPLHCRWQWKCLCFSRSWLQHGCLPSRHTFCWGCFRCCTLWWLTHWFLLVRSCSWSHSVLLGSVVWCCSQALQSPRWMKSLHWCLANVFPWTLCCRIYWLKACLCGTDWFPPPVSQPVPLESFPLWIQTLVWWPKCTSVLFVFRCLQGLVWRCWSLWSSCFCSFWSFWSNSKVFSGELVWPRFHPV